MKTAAPTIRASVPHAVLAAVLLVVTVGSSAPGAHPDPGPRDIDLLASAQPTAAQPVVADAASEVRRTSVSHVKADVTATASATCDGCSGESTALQVLYVSSGSQARLDNSAVAWTQACQGCTGTALSVQVVVVRGGPEGGVDLPLQRQLRPNNRALALNAACADCRTAAAAFQVVVLADHGRRLSGASMSALRSWFDTQAAVVRAAVAPSGSGAAPRSVGPSSPRRSAGLASADALAELERLVSAELDSSALLSEVKLGR